MALAAVSTPDVAKDLFSGLWDKNADQDLYQAYQNMDNTSTYYTTTCSPYIYPDSTYTASYSYNPAPSPSTSPVYNSQSPISTSSNCSEGYTGAVGPAAPVSQYTKLALLLISQSQKQVSKATCYYLAKQ